MHTYTQSQCRYELFIQRHVDWVNRFVIHRHVSGVKCSVKHGFLIFAQTLHTLRPFVEPCRRTRVWTKRNVHLLTSIKIISVVLRNLLVVSHQNMPFEALAAVWCLNPMLFSVNNHGRDVQRRTPIRMFISTTTVFPNV